MADRPSLALTESMTIEGWVRVDSFPSQSGQHGTILFRGDDRGGLDPYFLHVNPDGTIFFGISAGTSGAGLSAPMPSGEFVHVAATLDNATGQMNLYLNSVRVAHQITTARPFGDLDPGSNPGLGIGNHGGYPTTPHNFPFHGLIDELKVYDQALTAEEVAVNFHDTKGDITPSITISDAFVTEGETSMNFLGAFVEVGSGGLTAPRDMAYGPDGNFYVVSADTDSVLRYDEETGVFIDEFVTSGSGGLDFPRYLAFHNGDLFVSSTFTDSVMRFNGTTGAFIDEFITPGSGGLELPRGLLFGANNDLYVASTGDDDAILKFNATTGAFLSEFVASGDHGLNNPTRIVLGPDDNIYVSSTNSSSNSVLRYDADGTFIDTFVASGTGGLDGPTDMLFENGLFLVASVRSNSVLAYDQTTGEFIGRNGTAVSGRT